MIYFTIAFLISVAATLAVRFIAARFGVVDRPDGGRKRHERPVAQWGGLAIFVSFWAVTGYLLIWHPLYQVDIFSQKLLGVFIATLILVILGAWDDARSLPVAFRFGAAVIATLIAIGFGLGLQKITNPFGGYFNLTPVFGVADIMVFVWLLGMMFTTKILDGLDGLATGITAIGAGMIYFLTATPRFYQPNVGLLSLVFAGSLLGFLAFNFYPAKIFLGEGGSLLIGFILGVLAIISGGKIATALLVMAVPILDLGRVIYGRLRRGQPVFQGDRSHLHFVLLDLGLGERTTVVLLYAISFLFGITTLFLQSREKLVALLLLLVAMIALGWQVNRKK